MNPQVLARSIELAVNQTKVGQFTAPSALGTG